MTISIMFYVGHTILKRQCLRYMKHTFSYSVVSQDLATGVRKAFSGDIGTLLLELLMPPLEYEAYRLQHAMAVSGCFFLYTYFCRSLTGCLYLCVFLSPVWGMQGLGTDEETLMEILSTRSGKQLKEISAVYKNCK